jgi:uncharacterized membrane protein YdjX (TVP38/TMEM64 family)
VSALPDLPLEPAPGGAEPRPASRRRRAGALLLGAGVLVALACAVYLTPLRQIVTHPHELAERVRAAGPAAPVVFALAVTALIAVGVPRLLLCAAAGMTFGFAEGLLLSGLGTLLGSYLTFLFARWMGGERLLQRYPSLARHAERLRGGGVWLVLLARQVPLPTLPVNLLLGLTSVSHGEYLVGTLVGTLPESIPATLVGTGVARESLGETALLLSLALIAFAVAALVLRRVGRRGQLELGPDPAPPPAPGEVKP